MLEALYALAAIWAGLTVALYALHPRVWRSAMVEALGVTVAIVAAFAVAFGIVQIVRLLHA